ncbi:MAG: DUF4442 domain-containing protein [Bdellovibrionota bacterium]
MKVDSSFILEAWKNASRMPAGKTIFSLMIKRLIPYTGALGSKVLKLEKGKSEVRLKDRRGIRNHLSSIHAMALANLGEFATGLAVTTGIPPNHRAILKSFQIDYLKKARGTLIAKASYAHQESDEGTQDVSVSGNILNTQNETVATVQALWRIGKNK